MSLHDTGVPFSHMSLCACVWEYMITFINVQIYTCLWHTCTRFCTWMCMCAYIYITHIIMYSHIFIYRYTYIHICRIIHIKFLFFSSYTTIVSFIFFLTFISRTTRRALCSRKAESVTVCGSREALFAVTTWPATENKRSTRLAWRGIDAWVQTLDTYYGLLIALDTYANNGATSFHLFNGISSL